MITVSLLCSLYAWKGDKARVFKTLEWYDALCERAGYNFRLILVNDCSDESFDDIIPYITTPKGYCTEVQYFKSEVRLGKALQLNRLLASCNETYMGIVDNDVILPNNWLFGCMVIASKQGVGLCGVMVEDLPVHGKLQDVRSKIEFCLPQMLGGACLLWKSVTLGDEEYFWQHAGVYGHEDIEFIKRIDAKVGQVTCLAQKGYCISKVSDCPEYQAWKENCANSSDALVINRLETL